MDFCRFAGAYDQSFVSTSWAVARGSRVLLLYFVAVAVIAGLTSPPAQAAGHTKGHLVSKVANSTSAARIARPDGLQIPLMRPAQQANPIIDNPFRAAQEQVKADPIVLLTIAWKESSFDRRARNKHSSARGLMQFTAVTWLSVIRDFGGRHGLTQYAMAIKTGRDGRISVTTPRMRNAILALRDDANLQTIMAAELLGRERVPLEAHLGHSLNRADLYVLHLLGPGGARVFLAQLAEKPNTSCLSVVRMVVKPNEGLFVRDGRPLSVAEAYAGIQATLAEQATLHADLFPSPESQLNGRMLPLWQ